jgi:hypothetical protein
LSVPRVASSTLPPAITRLSFTSYLDLTCTSPLLFSIKSILQLGDKDANRQNLPSHCYWPICSSGFVFVNYHGLNRLSPGKQFHQQLLFDKFAKRHFTKPSMVISSIFPACNWFRNSLDGMGSAAASRLFFLIKLDSTSGHRQTITGLFSHTCLLKVATERMSITAENMKRKTRSPLTAARPASLNNKALMAWTAYASGLIMARD